MTESSIKRFESKYAKLNDNEKAFLQMLSLLSYPHKQTNIFNPLGKIPFEHLGNKRMKHNKMKSTLYSLLDKKMIKCDNDAKYFIPPELQIHIIIKHVSVNKSKEAMVDEILGSNRLYQYYYYEKKQDDLYREFRNAILLGLKYDEKAIHPAMAESFILRILATHFSPFILNRIPRQKREIILNAVVVDKIKNYESLDSIITYLATEFEENGNHATLYNILLAYLLLGKLQNVEKILKKNILKGNSELTLKASMFLMKGDIKAAKKQFERLKLNDKNHSGRSIFCPQGIFAKYHMLTQIATGDDASLATIVKVANKAIKGNKNDIASHALKATTLFLMGEEKKAHDIVSKKLTGDGYGSKLEVDCLSDAEILLTYLHSSGRNDSIHNYDLQEDIKRLFSKGYENGYFFNCYQALKLITAIHEKTGDTKLKITLSKENQVELLKKYEGNYIDYSKIVIPIPSWKAALNKLTLISSNSAKDSDERLAQSESRLIWKFHHMKYQYTDGSSLDIQPMEQVLNKNGTWSKGRKVALKRISEMEIDCMSELDKQIAKKAIICEHSYYHGYPKDEYSMDLEKALPLLAKHPYLFLAESIKTPVTLVQDAPHIEVTKSKNSFKLKLTPTLDGIHSYIIKKETPTRFIFTVFDNKVKQIAESLNDTASLNVPKKGAADLKKTLESLSRLVTVSSNAKELHSSETTKNSKKVKPISKIRIHLLPVADGIRAELFTRPFGTEGPYFKPGTGALNVMSEINGVPCEVVRDLKKERENAEKLLNATPSLANKGEINDTFYFESVFECLELLTEINELLDEVVVEWPEGGKLTITNTYGLQEMNFSVSSGTDWFSLTGDLKVDDKKILKISELIDKSKESRFVELDKGRFVALTESLRRKLDSISMFSHADGESLNIHPLNAHPINSLLAEAKSFKKGKEWKSNVAKIEKLADFKPEIPSTLSAELRPYQVDGVKWLARLAEWGVGACLADDMGLGKTVQALALVLSRAATGPTLVVAPASVCSNWISETKKFAPTLTPISFSEGDRAAILAKPKPFDLVVASYGLLASEDEAFSKINWSNIILDEAQYIKNHKAKRTKAALNLNGNFKLITTGTPVENHLAELWTLFSFINPGLLGTKQQFDAKFAVPIERDGAHHQRLSLKKLIQPFLLRRLKSAVLDELPPKTEINMMIEMSPDEKAFYEALRRESIQTVEEAKKTPGGAAHLKILAELMKLRQACCAPSLISKDLKIKSSKLEAFSEIIEELRENRHKALVFSQFIGHLSILREFCDSHSIKYQYLDGSTPAKERSKRVDAFQNGEGDLFLISLKAGGTGLNLTAADYVIHMDPWWNPAVEDQASDRTHRIGQKRPVTVYRMIAKGTVEEKIIDLHKSKRELADALLDGAEASAKMSLDDLLAILSDSASV